MNVLFALKYVSINSSIGKVLIVYIVMIKRGIYRKDLAKPKNFRRL